MSLTDSEKAKLKRIGVSGLNKPKMTQVIQQRKLW